MFISHNNGVFSGEYLSAYIWVDVGDQLKYPENKVLR